MPYGAPGTKQINVYIDPDLRDWTRNEARRLRLPLKIVVEISLQRLRDHIETNGDAEFFPPMDLIPAVEDSQ
jgi:hypothetical protein